MATKLKHAIVETGVKQRWLAQKVGVNPTTLNMIVNGKSLPTLRTAQKIAQTLNTTVDLLWPLEEEERRVRTGTGR